MERFRLQLAALLTAALALSGCSFTVRVGMSPAEQEPQDAQEEVQIPLDQEPSDPDVEALFSALRPKWETPGWDEYIAPRLAELQSLESGVEMPDPVTVAQQVLSAYKRMDGDTIASFAAQEFASNFSRERESWASVSLAEQALLRWYYGELGFSIDGSQTSGDRAVISFTFSSPHTYHIKLVKQRLLLGSPLVTEAEAQRRISEATRDFRFLQKREWRVSESGTMGLQLVDGTWKVTSLSPLTRGLTAAEAPVTTSEFEQAATEVARRFLAAVSRQDAETLALLSSEAVASQALNRLPSPSWFESALSAFDLGNEMVFPFITHAPTTGHSQAELEQMSLEERISLPDVRTYWHLKLQQVNGQWRVTGLDSVVL